MVQGWTSHRRHSVIITPLRVLYLQGVLRLWMLRLSKQVISPLSELKIDSFISSIFITEKPDGSHRTILNLKKLNESIRYVHFNMESLKNVIQLIRQGFGWGPSTSVIHTTVSGWMRISKGILHAIGKGVTMSFYVCLMGMLRHPLSSPSY